MPRSYRTSTHRCCIRGVYAIYSRYISSLIFTGFFCVTALAQKYNYENYWIDTKVKSHKINFTLYTKNSPLGYLQNIATATVSNDNTESKEKIYSTFKNAISTKKWTTDSLDGIEFHESYDAKSTTLFRFAYNPKNKQYSFGSVKLRYLMPSYLELHLMQVEKLTGQKSKKTAVQLFELLAPRVYSEADQNGLCTKSGPYIESKKELERRLLAAAKNCPNRIFSKNLVQAQALKKTLSTPKGPASIVASAQTEEKPTLISRFKDWWGKTTTNSASSVTVESQLFN